MSRIWIKQPQAMLCAADGAGGIVIEQDRIVEILAAMVQIVLAPCSPFSVSKDIMQASAGGARVLGRSDFGTISSLDLSQLMADHGQAAKRLAAG